MTRPPTLILYSVGLLAAGCTVGPDYKRPEVPIPPAYRGADAGPQAAGPASFGDLKWWEVFQDPVLQELIRTALVENYDLRVAVSRILQAQTQVTVARSQQVPTLDGQVSAPYRAFAGGDRPPTFPRDSFEPQGGVGIAWELDLWGKFRRNTEASWADLLAAEEVRLAVMTTLVSEVAQAYFSLRNLDLQLEISERTVASRVESRDLVQARLDGGVVGIIDLRQAETLLYTATKAIPDLKRQIEQTENFINILLGGNPGPIQRGRALNEQLAVPAVPAVPPGLPSDLLARRPDILQAEQQLVSANAEIGVAKSLLFPQVTISGFAGAGGAVIDGTTFGPYGVFSVLPVITLPIFNRGRLRAGVEFNEARAQEAVLRYQQTIQQAVREVSDALVEVRRRQETLEQQVLLTRNLEDESQVAKLRYEGGVSSYLEVLDTERQLFDAQLDSVQAQLDVFLGVVQLYKALGGGWQSEPPASPPAGVEESVAVATSRTVDR